MSPKSSAIVRWPVMMALAHLGRASQATIAARTMVSAMLAVSTGSAMRRSGCQVAPRELSFPSGSAVIARRSASTTRSNPMTTSPGSEVTDCSGLPTSRANARDHVCRSTGAFQDDPSRYRIHVNGLSASAH
ncbi:MAG: hypothetical protein EBT22_03045 [Chloroflexi bacterium]|nr:hypothetical protein [Chloroflexota bacterium]